MAGENYTNLAGTVTTTAPVGTSDPEVISLTSVSGYPAAPFWAEIDKDTGLAEIVRVTNVAGNNVTCARGQGGTAMTSHGAGASFNHIAPADFFNRSEAHMQASTAVHGVSGSIVGTAGSQTVSDKLFRGAAKSQHSDALPAGITASFESVADTTAARDGFVHRNTGGSAARSAFLAQQSGTDRFKVSNTGNVTVNPSTGTALTVSAGGASVAGGLDVTSGGVDVTGGAVVAGGLIATGGIDLGATTVDSLSSDTTIHASGAIDTDSTLTVDGASTLTGAVAMGAGATVANGLTVAQAITSWGGRVVISVASAASVTSPVAGDVIYDRADGMWKRYSGSAWVNMNPGDGGAVSHHGEYTLGSTAALQALAAGVTEAVSMGATVVRSTPHLTVGTASAGSGSTASSAFTVNTTGDYDISFTIGWESPGVNVLLTSWVALDGNSNPWWAHQRFNAGSSAVDLGSEGSFTTRFTAGQKFCVHVNASVACNVNNTNLRTRLQVRYLGG